MTGPGAIPGRSVAAPRPERLGLPMRTRPIAGLALAACLTGCSVNPTYEVRVVNESSMTVDAALTNARNLVRQETLASARIPPNREAVLGPIEAPPLDPVELRVARPEDMGATPERHRLRRGRWTATVAGAGQDSWEPVSVRVERAPDQPAEP